MFTYVATACSSVHNLLANCVYMRACTNLDSEMVGTTIALYCDYLTT